MLKIQFRDKRQEPVWVVEKVFTIGSASDNSLVIDDPSVSAHHARLISEDGEWTLQDTGSTAGTFVNDRRVNQHQVGYPDVIRCGQVELEVVDPLANSASQELPYWALIADASWLAGQEFPLIPAAAARSDSTHTDLDAPPTASVLIGRGSHCDVVFPGTHLSREHARVTIAADHITLADLRSANGTYVNDQRVKGEIRAVAGDKVRLDIYSFTLLGPGIKLPQSSTHPLPKADAQTSTVRQDELNTPKQWKTRPTSPGNREEAVTSNTNTLVIWLSVVLIVCLVGIAAYLLIS